MLGPHKHRTGSRSYARVAEKDRDASYIDVLRKTHKKSDGSLIDERARLISERFEKNVDDHMFFFQKILSADPVGFGKNTLSATEKTGYHTA